MLARAVARLVPAGMLLLGPLIYFRLLLPGSALADFDATVYLFPYRSLWADAVAHGRLPLWTSSVFMGMPFLANIQTGSLYPPNVAYLLVPAYAATGILVALHMGVAALGMFLYARDRHATGVAGGVVAGAVYAFGAFMTSHAGLQSEVLAWAPWVMVAAARLVDRPGTWRAAALAVAAALPLLAGHTQQTWYCYVLGLLAALPEAWRALRLREFGRLLWAVPAGLAAVALGAGLAALQLAPTAELVSWSARSGGLGLAQAGEYSLRVRGILGDLLPDYLGEHRAEFSWSIGAAALVAVALAVVLRLRRGDVRYWLVAGLLALAVGLGPTYGLFTLVYHVLPGLALYRVPARALAVTTVALAILAGIGTCAAVETAVHGERRWRAVLLALGLTALAPLAVLADAAAGNPDRFPFDVFPRSGYATRNLAILCAFAALAGAVTLLGTAVRRGQVAAVGLPLLVLADLFLLGAPTYPRNPLPDRLYTDPPVAEQLTPGDLDHRSLVLIPIFQGLPQVDALPAGLGLAADQIDRYTEFRRLTQPLQPNLGAVWGRASADGYDAGVIPLREQVAYRAPLLPAGSGNQYELAIRDLTGQVWSVQRLRDMGVSVVVTALGADPNPPGRRDLVPTNSAGHLQAWALTGPAPTRAYVDTSTGRLAAQVVADTGSRVEVALPGAAGQLVLADAWYPGWTVSVDGRPLEIARRDGFTRAVPVPAGARTAVFSYRPGWLAPAAAASVLSLVAVVALLMLPDLGWRRRGGPAPAAPEADPPEPPSPPGSGGESVPEPEAVAEPPGWSPPPAVPRGDRDPPGWDDRRRFGRP